MRNPLDDKEFLRQLDQEKEREIYAKIISLSFEEDPIEEITGRITSGSVSIDGSSKVRRTCSLSLVAQELNIHEFYWGLTTKFKLYVGLKNKINSLYPDIIWFPFGTYVISSFNTSQNTNSYSVSIQGRDKMTLLNGTFGGNVMSLSADFGTETVLDDNGISTKQSLLVKNIIREVVHEYAREPYHNIIITDLDMCGLELMEYRGNDPMYFLVDADTDEVSNMTMNGNQGKYYYKNYNNTLGTYDKWSNVPQILLKNIPVYDNRTATSMARNYPTLISTDKIKAYSVIKAEYGDSVGYRVTDLVYAGDLIAQVGNNVASAVLDKIVSMLGDYEYFYDLYGRFIFQRKKSYLNTSWNNIRSDSEEKQVYVEAAAETSAITYSFEDANLITSFQNNPDFDNLKNDYAIWGTRTTISGNEIPVHLRYAIDIKPKYYKNYNGDTYISKEYENPQSNQIVCDWREIIYQMASDYMKHNHDDNFISTIAANNKEVFPTGYTGYEMYYTDIYSFWRDLYKLDYDYTYNIAYVTKSEYEKNPSDYYWYQQGNSNETYLSSNIYYYQDAYNVYQKIYNMTEYKYKANPSYYYTIKQGNSAIAFDSERDYYTRSSDDYITEKNYKKFNTSVNNIGWNIDVIQSPQLLNFWFDFLDTSGDLDQYSVRNVGTRSKAENDSDVKAIYFRDIPSMIFIGMSYAKEQIKSDLKINYANYGLTKEKYEAMSQAQIDSFIVTNNLVNKLIQKQHEEMPGYTFIQLPNYMENLFTISSQGKSAKDTLDSWLYQYAYCTESISISALPIYYLEPNTRIYVRDDNSNINGEYIIDKITIPLQYSGTMNITATKAAERIY